ncbi:MAG: phosphatase PAP2 family protein [Candidatus Eisenbacteria bacterium]|nr:phosphatase PAP2 family protein [Candidatus Eisenbacteria bacterium]
MTPAAIGLLSYFEQLHQARSFTALVLIFVGFVIAAFLTRTGAVLRLDARLTSRLQGLRSAPLDRLMRVLTILGDPPALFVAGGAGALLFWAVNQREAGILTALSLLGLPLNYAIKELIRRPRPDQTLVRVLLPVTGRSFPSGHAMTATMLYGFMAFVIWVHAGRGMPGTIATLALVLTILGVGLSRIYLGVHWFSDVMGGWTAGIFFLLIMASLYGALVSPQ